MTNKGCVCVNTYIFTTLVLFLCNYVSFFMYIFIQTYVHIKRNLQRIGFRDFGGWQVLRAGVSKLGTQESQWCSSSPKGSQLEVQKAPVFQFKCKVFGEDQCPSSKQSDKRSSLLLSPSFLYCSSYLQLIGWAHLGAGTLLCSVYWFKY